MVTRLVFGFLALLGLLIVAANVTVFFLFWRRSSLRVKANYILASLAFSDCMSGLLAIPLLIACSSMSVYDEVVCVGMRFLAISTILHLTTALRERYFKIVNSFRHRSVVTKCRVVIVVVLIWLLALISALAQTTWSNHPRASEIYLTYDITVLVVLVVLPFISIMVAYTSMFLIIKRGKMRRKKLSGHHAVCLPSSNKKYKQNERKAVTVYFVMALCFAVGWFPYFVLTILDDLKFEIDIPFWLTVMFLYLKYATSLVDPLLFTFFKEDFQRALKSLRRR
ncbi:predicted protein [Nematostella vectensis]|uniref:G-protein coupled receptors family 1 profile domain-containing protein n=1 Tax=Nematostella vectensis TaxID=45351 RepID=A7S6V6_NEMVE|nr:5-hydroxytryptamine receptor 4 [Nematostella vectensis]EDO40589.1 predicted protein [Nematostella vectensis]|eukprot:XP_001632652.1 predicted protein [Nematostella vectensis]